MGKKSIWLIVAITLVFILVAFIYSKNQFDCCKDPPIAKMNQDELKELFDGESFILPEGEKLEFFTSYTSPSVQGRIGELSGFAMKINNVLTNSSDFSYKVSVANTYMEKFCGASKEKIESWITSGKEGSLTIEAGESYITKVLFMIPKDQPLCTIELKVEVFSREQPYASEFLDMNLMA